ncbi:MAG: hypothetical protein GY769_08035 [bacterium]|nr:hypothetical protein [bacterium]
MAAETGPVVGTLGTSEELRRCVRCGEIRLFKRGRCDACGNRICGPDESGSVYSERCSRCRRLVAATIGGLCGACAAREEHSRRHKNGVLTKDDRAERNYAKGRSA